MNVVQMNSLRKSAFSSLTIRKSFHKSQLEESIRSNPEVFVQLATQYKLNPQQQMELMSFFLNLAIQNSRIHENYRVHLNLFLSNLTYTWLWPSSVSLFRNSLTLFGVSFVDPASYY